MWEKILKIEIRNFVDAKRVSMEYALEAYYESKILSEEEYQNLSSREKYNLHKNLVYVLKKYGKDSWAEDRRAFHDAMAERIRRGDRSTMLPTTGYRPQRKAGYRKQVEEQMERAKTKSQMILDYFKMWRNMYNRLPTLTEITNSEGRPLTVDEERTYNEEYARRTQE